MSHVCHEFPMKAWRLGKGGMALYLTAYMVDLARDTQVRLSLRSDLLYLLDINRYFDRYLDRSTSRWIWMILILCKRLSFESSSNSERTMSKSKPATMCRYGTLQYCRHWYTKVVGTFPMWQQRDESELWRCINSPGTPRVNLPMCYSFLMTTTSYLCAITIIIRKSLQILLRA